MSLIPLIQSFERIRIKGPAPQGLHDAIEERDHKKIGVLLSKGANPNARDKEQMTPLERAFRLCDANSVELLLRYGANLHRHFEQNPLTYRLLLDVFRSTKLFGKFVHYGMDVHVCDTTHRQTPLHHAVDLQNHAAVEVLIAAEADVNCQDIHGRTPMHYAAFNSDHISLYMLRQAHADMSIKDNEGRTPQDITDPESINLSFIYQPVMPLLSLCMHFATMHLIRESEFKKPDLEKIQYIDTFGNIVYAKTTSKTTHRPVSRGATPLPLFKKLKIC